MSSPQELNVSAIKELLHELGRRLAARGIRAELYIFGGAAVAMAYNARRITGDIDAYMRPSEEVYKEARKMARELGLSDGWLSGDGAAWLPNLPAGWQDDGEDFSGLRVSVADPRTPIAMKLIASRARDTKDLVLLFREVGIESPEEAVAIVRDLYPDGVATRESTDEELEIEAQEILELLAQEAKAAGGSGA